MAALSLTRIRQMAAGGAASVVITVLIGNSLRIVSSMTLTRLLDAHAFGVVGVITSIAFMVAMISDVGMYDFILRHQEGDDPIFLDQIWTVKVVRGAILTLMMAVLAWPASWLLGKPELAPVVAVWSISFLIDGLGSLAFVIGPRKRMLWRVSMLDLSASIATLIVSVSIALIYASFWAMIIGMIVGTLVKSILSYAIFPESRRAWHLHAPRFQELWGFSRFIAMSSLLTIFVMQIDKLVLARLMPLSAYGFYAIAITLAGAPAGIANPYTLRVLYPAYAAAARESPEKLRALFYPLRRKVLTLYMFGVGGLIGGASLMIALLYDPRYGSVTPFLQLLLISTGLRMGNMASQQALVALGNTKTTLTANIWSTVWLFVGGGAALLMNNILLLVTVVGTVEVAAMLSYFRSLRQEGILDLRQEAVGWGAMVAGAGVGWVIAHEALTLFPRL
jgi:O-antigen/teichoic acid export membrane protein